jgi:autotransporter-associated beta strand protein
MSNGNLTVNNSMRLGVNEQSSGTYSQYVNGSFTMYGGTATITPGILLGTHTSTDPSVATASVTIAGGTLLSGGDITNGAGATFSIVTLNGGTLNMGGNNLGNAARSIDNLSLQSGTLLAVNEINGGASVTKTTAGLLTLLGTNAWTGNTLVSAGTLAVNGWLPNSAVTVPSGGTLAGSGTLSGSVTVDGGTLSPGNSIGTLTVGSLTLTNNLRLTFELGATNASDSVIVTGTLTFSGMETNWFVLTATNGFDTGTYTLFQAGLLAGTGLGAVTNFTDVGGSGMPGYLFLDGANVRLEVFPEPGAGALVAGGLALMWLLRRRR